MLDESDPTSALRALFEHAWGASLAVLCAPSPPPLPPLSAERLARAQHEARTRGAASALLTALVSTLHARNQFLEIDGAGERSLLRSIDGALAAVAGGDDVERALSHHRAELAAFVRARLGSAPRDVVAAAYSPSLQWRVLGLSEELARAPVLDVGCGPDAALVRFLRERGIAAEGIDRAAQGELAQRADWLTFDYGSARWGTVLSHLGFSLHFLHQHLAGRDRAFEYARVYMAILRALARHGRFVYTPGLPFLERLLDARSYRVHHVPFAGELRIDALTEIEQRTGLALSHATHVERLA